MLAVNRTFLPKLPGDRDGRYLYVRPVLRLVSKPVQLLMVPAAEPHREFIICFPPQGPKLRNLEMVRTSKKMRFGGHDGAGKAARVHPAARI
jgi:hypothetical protein